MNKSIFKFLNKYKVMVILVIVFIISSVIDKNFLTLNNIKNILLSVSTDGTIAVGMTIIMITGGIDLSVGAMVALTSVVVIIYQLKWGSWVGVLIAIAIGLIIGLFNGILVGKIKVNPFITTLGTQTFVFGLALRLSGARAIMGNDPNFAYLASRPILGIPFGFIVFLIVVIFSDFLLIRTRFGRNILAVGGNPEACRLSGLIVNWYVVLAYVFGSFTAVLGGIILTSRINAGSTNIIGNTLINVIAAVLLGGTSLTGGSGRPINTLFGILIIGIIGNSMNLKGVGGFAQTIIIGFILIIVMLLDSLSKKATRVLS